MKRIISFILTLSLLFGLLPQFALPTLAIGSGDTEDEALGEISVVNGGYTMAYLTVNGKLQKYNYVYFSLHNTATGEKKTIPAYCVNPSTPGVVDVVGVGEGVKYLADALAGEAKRTGIISNGYPHRTLAELNLDNPEQGYYATKIALWCYLMGWGINNIQPAPGLSGKELDIANRLRDAAIFIYKNGTAWTSIMNPKIILTADSSNLYSAQLNGQDVKMVTYTATSNTFVVDEEATIQVSPGSNAPAGTQITDMDNNPITKLPFALDNTTGFYKAKFKVIVPSDSIDGQSGSILLDIGADVYKYQAFYATCQEKDKYGTLQQYLADSDPIYTTQITAETRYSASPAPTPPDEGGGDNPEGTYIKIVKNEKGTNTPLEGAVFELIDPHGHSMGSRSTDANGVILWTLTEAGNYTLTEVNAPNGYKIIGNPTQNVNVEYGETTTVTVDNEKYGDLLIRKLDADTGEGLADCTLELTHVETGRKLTATTQAGGEIQLTGLELGAWEVREIAAPYGYVLDGEMVKTVNLVSGLNEIAFKDKAKPGLKIVKYDSETYELLQNTTFEIYKDSALFATKTTDIQGEIVLYDLEPGTYLVKEIKAAPGHVLDPNPQQIELKAGGGILELLFFNDNNPDAIIRKVDSQTLKPLSGAVFEIKSIPGSTVGFHEERTTDEKGEINLSDLPIGSYQITEKKAPEGYLIDNNTRTIELKGNDNVTFVFTNTGKPSFDLIKIDALTGKPVPGASFRIAKIEDGTHYLDRVTDSAGRILIDGMKEGLEPGVYSVRETSAPEGYVLNPKEYHVELFSGKTSELVVSNDQKPDLKIIKTDAVTGARLPGTTFTINKVDSSTLTTETTDGNGEILLENMEPGVYEITEKSVPNGYLLDEIPQKITLVPNKTGIVQFRNYPKPDLIIHKLDSITKDPVKGAKFHIWRASNNTFTGEINDLGTFFTDENGQIILEKQDDGWYRVTEEEPAKGYAIKEPATQEIYLKAGENKEITFENVPLSAIIIKKIDADTKAPIEGARFRVRYLAGTSGTGGTIIGEYATSANGTIVLTGLQAGSYVIEEFSPAPNYEIVGAAQTVYLSGKEQDVITVEFTNAKYGSMLIRKLDSVTRQPLSGVVFLVTDSEGTFIGNENGLYTTDSAGTIQIPNIKPGTTLIVKEVKTKDGYVLDATPQSIKIVSNETKTLEFLNTPLGGVLIKKLDSETRQPLSGVAFKVTYSGGENVGNGEFITDENGCINLTGLKPEATIIVQEIRAKEGYLLNDTPQTVKITGNQLHTLTFLNTPLGSLLIKKLDSETHQPLSGVAFQVTYSDGSVVGNANGEFITDSAGTIRISGLKLGQTVIVKEIRAKDGYLLDDTAKTIQITGSGTHTLEFLNKPLGGLKILKLDEETRQPIKGVEFDVTYMNGKKIGTYRTDANGAVYLHNLSGWITVIEKKAAKGYQLDSQPHNIEVLEGGTAELEITNRKASSVLLHKVDSITGKGIYGVVFLISDENGKPIGQYTSDQNGYVYIDNRMTDGKFTIREISVPEGYVIDPEIKTFYVEYGGTSQIEWKNTPTMGQIQIVKKSADDNQQNALPAGSVLPGAVFEIRNRAGDVVETVATDSAGRAVSKALPLGRYTVHETKAPDFYAVNPSVFDAEIEFSGQIIRIEVLDKSIETGVSIQKRGYAEAVPNQTIRYDFKNIANESSVPLESFYWRDVLPSDAVRLQKIITGSYNRAGRYKVVYKTNIHDEYRVIADNLSTQKSYVLDASPAALGLAANEYLTEFMFAFGTVQSGFAQVEAPYIFCNTLPNLPHEYRFVNRADAGGQYQGQWHMAIDRWVTVIYNKETPPTLPKTGY